MCEQILMAHGDEARRQWVKCVPTEAEEAGRVTLTGYLAGIDPADARAFRDEWLERPLAKPVRTESEEERTRRVADELRRQKERLAPATARRRR